MNDQVREEFQRNFALQFFIPRQPDDSHAAPPEDFDQRVAAKELLTPGELAEGRVRDIARALVRHARSVSTTWPRRKFKPKGRSFSLSAALPCRLTSVAVCWAFKGSWRP